MVRVLEKNNTQNMSYAWSNSPKPLFSFEHSLYTIEVYSKVDIRSNQSNL